jgi:hypothetical protein
MQLTHLFTWDGSGGENCPAVYGTDSGDLVIQGYALAGDETLQLDKLADNEAGVRIPYGLAEQIADLVNARRG